jgi:tRNA pseudouridine32 synthase/23S rRNA pseudouridine746 synthase
MFHRRGRDSGFVMEPKVLDPKVLDKVFDPKNATENEILARVLHRDGLMLVIDKPAGLSVHRGPKGGPSLEDWFGALRFGLPRGPELAHRLDRETSGCLVLGRHRKALAHLSLLFKHRRIGKTYWAVVEGGPDAEEGTIDMPLGRLDPEFGWWMKPDPSGQPAVTKWKVMGRFSSSDAPLSPPTSPWRGEVDPPQAGRVGVNREANMSPHPGGFAADPPPPGEGADRLRGESKPQLTWLALEPITGRTHQLRVHCAAMGFPIFGDDIYGNEASQRRARQIKFVPRADAPGLQLHAREVVVPISKNKEPVRVTAPVPAHLRERFTLCGWNGE